MVDTQFDYIIIGAGSAGCVIANRLTANADVRVALIEAGPSDLNPLLNLKTSLPIGNIFTIPDARYNWSFEFTGSDAVNGRTIPCPRGKLFGGCSSVNGSIYMRGHPSDYDGWEALGNSGWGYLDVLPFFKRHENWAGQLNRDYHGSGGELDTTLPLTPNPIAMAYIKAAQEAGHIHNVDFNGPAQDGFGLATVNQRRGIRLSSSRAFLHPVIGRRNLQVFADTLVESIDFAGDRAVGVTSRRGATRIQLRAAREVILCAGAINSPQLLMLSGVGPAAHLRRHNIKTVLDLPGVGQNLQDHPTVVIAAEDPSTSSYALSWAEGGRIASEAVKYALTRKGMFSSNGGEVAGFIRTQPNLTRPDVQFTFFVGLKENVGLSRRHGHMTAINICRPKSRGCVELRSNDPQDKPVLHPNFMEDKADVDTLVRGVRATRDIMSRPALARFTGAEIKPGHLIETDEQLEQFVRANVSTVFHPVGTCKMGPDADNMAVVDQYLRVRGIEGLRIADASVMPAIVGANTNAPSMMIGERAAAFILGETSVAKERHFATT